MSYGFHLAALHLATEAASLKRQYKELTEEIELEHAKARAAAFDEYEAHLDEARILTRMRSEVATARLVYTRPLIYVGVDVMAY